MLSAIYEEDFLGFSYGFRPKRSQHDALDALIVGISAKKVNYILDADIRSFFTEVSQQWVIRFLKSCSTRSVMRWLSMSEHHETVQICVASSNPPQHALYNVTRQSKPGARSCIILAHGTFWPSRSVSHTASIGGVRPTSCRYTCPRPSSPSSWCAQLAP